MVVVLPVVLKQSSLLFVFDCTQGMLVPFQCIRYSSVLLSTVKKAICRLVLSVLR
jgi:hypothetical protein